MKHQVIVADDSQTIQKVISITLASEPFEITECLEIKNLNSAVLSVSPKIVLLDFNLSEDKTGYDLCREIKAQSPNSFVVFLFGTFDTIDEDLINECGASNWIVKPFDGNKFINLCRNLVDHDPTKTLNNVQLDEIPEEIEPKVNSEVSDDWVMDVPSTIENDSADFPAPIKDNHLNVLENSMQDWGIEIPGVIGKESENISDIPEVISEPNEQETSVPENIKFEEHIENTSSKIEEFVMEETHATESPSVDEAQEDHFPDGEDLEYPDMIEIENKPTLELTSLEDLNLETEPTESVDNLYAKAEPETDVETLKEQIQDEQEDLWSLDADEDEQSAELNSFEDNSTNLHVLHETPADFPEDVMSERNDSEQEQVIMQDNLSDEVVADVVQELSKEVSQDDPESKDEETVIVSEAPSQPIDMDELIDRLRPMIEELVKAECQKIAEKVSWEIIPDLAENLIKGELEKISDQVLDQ